MTSDFVVQTMREMFLTAFWISAPLLLAGFVAGILMSLIQIVTSIQDSGFSAVPRLVTFLVATLLLLPWMMSRLMSYSIGIFSDLARYAR